ncbi:YcbK family protein [Ornithobacterium rhinotracheale]|uniref:YcbK family protein n=1 Tax=Ornithobacterium rhinotracheale TaxID=28251 RepID=UPI001FF2483A|nr:D-Ala-D-Ala carboxypeptidase family metallohydrolase [Ornithobacterium rhinotracheale]MCK0199251.1 D-Ala-D-Ala carboxypeptidase family metallohydrolase [Ornithobacterium rhinotracheale]
MKLSKDFDLSEFACHDGSTTPAFALKNLRELAQNLQVLRNYLGKPIMVNSGYRSVAHNRKIGGKVNSQHLQGKAADIRVEGVNPAELAQVIEKLIASGQMKQGGLGIYPTFVHYDIRGTKARWKG